MKLIPFCNKIIEYSFYSLFLLVPLIFSGSPSELFEFPKMWLTFGVTILIGASWLTKMILLGQIKIQRTPLDIPILLFLIANIISTIFSLDTHVSLWGYYSRFNGGLLSIISYLFLYYAAVSNLTVKHILNLLKVSLFSGLIVALWGIPSHFGIDPTCYVFRGSFDTSCWTEAFKPTIRIFSTLGQPAWLAAYMSVLIPISAAFALINLQGKNLKFEIRNLKFVIPAIFVLLFYASLVYTDTRGGFIGFWVANIIFWGGIYFKKLLPKKNYIKYFLIFNLLFLLFNFFQGIPISQLSKFTLPELSKTTQNTTLSAASQTPSGGALGGTDSGKIRLLVWRGAINAWKENPVIGTGVETFAYAYYQYRPAEHNLTSEWDYLYNKAHNEYLNYLTTTGILGLGSYLAIIGAFLFLVLKKLNWEVGNGNVDNEVRSWKSKKSHLSHQNQASHIPHPTSIQGFRILIIALISAYVSILISNFFGFSVVIINLYFFLIPAFVFILGGFLNDENVLVFPSRKSEVSSQKSAVTKSQWILLTALILTSCFLLLSLANYYRADIAYAKGSNLANGGGIQEAYPFLIKATSMKSNEPVFKDELSLNMGTLAAALYLQKDASSGAELAKEAIALNDNVVASHPHNIVFWKNRVRLFYTLAKGDPEHEKTYLKEALTSIQKAQSLAPTDAKVSYNLGVMVGQTGDLNRAIQVLENTIKLKPDYRDAYFALGLFYDELGNRQKAVDSMEYILKNIDPTDEQIIETLESWNSN